MLGFSRILVFAILRFSPSLSLAFALSHVRSLPSQNAHTHLLFSRALSLSVARAHALPGSLARALSRSFLLSHSFTPAPALSLVFCPPALSQTLPRTRERAVFLADEKKVQRPIREVWHGHVPQSSRRRPPGTCPRDHRNEFSTFRC